MICDNCKREVLLLVKRFERQEIQLDNTGELTVSHFKELSLCTACAGAFDNLRQEKGQESSQD